MSSWKPKGYNSASPYLIVSNAKGTIEFLKAVFDAQELRCLARSDGKISHAEVRIDDTVVMLSDETEGWPLIPSHVHIYVLDVDACYGRALEAGAQPVSEPVRKDDIDKRGGVKDAGGTTWWISTLVG